MSRVKRGTISMKRRRKVLSKVKGYRFGRSTKEREAKVAIIKAGAHAFAHRRDKKNDFRQLWNIRINAGVRPHGLSYSRLIGNLKKKNIILNRKMLAMLAAEEPETLSRLLSEL